MPTCSVQWSSRTEGIQRVKRARLTHQQTWGDITCHSVIGDVGGVHQDCLHSVFACSLPVALWDDQPIHCAIQADGSTANNALLYYSILNDRPPTPVAPIVPAAPGRKRAVIVGVSKYSRRRGNDLEWCDEDANRQTAPSLPGGDCDAWYHYLSARGFECFVYGNSHPMPAGTGPPR